MRVSPLGMMIVGAAIALFSLMSGAAGSGSGVLCGAIFFVGGAVIQAIYDGRPAK